MWKPSAEFRCASIWDNIGRSGDAKGSLVWDPTVLSHSAAHRVYKTQNCLFHVGRNERGAIGDTDVQSLSEGLFVCRVNILFCRNHWYCLILYSQCEWNLSPEQNRICTKEYKKYIFCFYSHYIIYNIFKRVKKLLSRWVEVYRQDVITAFLNN